ncbi:MAG TPA: hypothetical protein VM686_09095 [Polyangiaceae bacterium]|jgi:Arc/MetJ-type ribon-helix-helix transcriptional regulator|nr:hypothetical protein [Polyangiaceae bacterium]
MTAAKIAITLPPEQLAKAQQAVRRGRARSVSAYISQALAAQDRADTLQVLVGELVREHGEPTRSEEAWARRVLKRVRRA